MSETKWYCMKSYDLGCCSWLHHVLPIPISFEMRIPSRPIHYFTDLSHQGRVKYENRTAKVRAGLVAIIVLGSVIDIRVQSLKSRLMPAHNQTTTQISFSTRTFLNNKSYRKDEKFNEKGLWKLLPCLVHNLRSTFWVIRFWTRGRRSVLSFSAICWQV